MYRSISLRWAGWAVLLLAACSGAWAQPGSVWKQVTNLPEWTARGGHTTVVFQDKLWILGGYYGSGRKNDVWCSEDGAQWTQVDTQRSPQMWGPRSGHVSVVFDDKIWVMGGSDGEDHKDDIWYSSDGAIWTQAAPTTAVWTPRDRHSAVVLNDRIYVIGGFDGKNLLNDVWFTPDGIRWTRAVDRAAWAARHHHASLVFNEKMWLIGGDDGEGRCNDVWFSWDGATWIQATKRADWPPRYLHTAVALNGRIWVIGGHGAGTNEDLGDVWSSEDGILWEQAQTRPSAVKWTPRHMHGSAIFKDRMWVIGGNGYAGGRTNDVWSSADGSTWQQETRAAGWSVRNRHAAVVFQDKLWVMGGFSGNVQNNDVWSSADGAEWAQSDTTLNVAMWSARYGLGALAYSNQLWVIGGCDTDGLKNDIWFSPDGATWEQTEVSARRKTFSQRNNHVVTEFLGKMWVLGGRDSTGLRNDVWNSYDGIRWQMVTEKADWSPREYHAAVSLGGKLFVIGGNDGFEGRKNDVWFSQDGSSWTSMNTAASKEMWTPRTSHTAVVEAYKIWLMGGYDETGLCHDVWSSNDGLNWSLVTNDAPWRGRESHASVAFKGNIYVIGGFTENLLNDVWCSEITPKAAPKEDKPAEEGAQPEGDAAQSDAAAESSEEAVEEQPAEASEDAAEAEK